jgi:SAM-dependent methyltransferase
MSHAAQRIFVDLVSKTMSRFFNGCDVLEVGSLDINGSVRDFFKNCRYIGLDVGGGKGVDVVCQGQEYDGPDDSRDQVISCEAMEHNPYWAATFANMLRICKPGGLVLMTCAAIGRKEHGTTRSSVLDSPLTIEMGWNYYRNLLPRNFLKILNFEQAFYHHRFWVNWNSYDLYFCGIKAGSPETQDDEWDSMVNHVEAYVSMQNQGKVFAYRAFVARWFGDNWFRFWRDMDRRLTLRFIRKLHD